MQEDHSGFAELLLDPPFVQSRMQIRVPAGQTLHEALEMLAIRPFQPVIPLINGTVEDLNYRLQPGDTVRFLAQIAGGSC